MTAAAQQPSRAAGFSQRRRLRSGLVSAGVLSTLLGGLLLAVPGLGAIGHRVTHAHWGWLMLGAGLELASCVGYVLAFQGIFKEVPARFAALVATAEQAFGAVVPVGGAGGIAAGSWLLSRAGLPLGAIAERSAVLFLLTSATNVVALVLAGAGLAIGAIAGPRNLVLSAVPAGAGLAVLILFVGLARCAPGRTGTGSILRSRVLRAIAGASATTARVIRRPGWRLAVGALTYLFCDIAVLWLAIHALGYEVPVAPWSSRISSGTSPTPFPSPAASASWTEASRARCFSITFLRPPHWAECFCTTRSLCGSQRFQGPSGSLPLSARSTQAASDPRSRTPPTAPASLPR